MGLFDKFKKNKESENKETVETVDTQALGWDAVTAEFERVYPGQTNPKHYGTLIKWALGGKDPLDGISIYDGGDYWHFVTYGMTELYEKEGDNDDISGFVVSGKQGIILFFCNTFVIFYLSHSFTFHLNQAKS